MNLGGKYHPKRTKQLKLDLRKEDTTDHRKLRCVLDAIVLGPSGSGVALLHDDSNTLLFCRIVAMWFSTDRFAAWILGSS